jgi:tRNA A-37 threonylcarbamoyl transferase component Bud32
MLEFVVERVGGRLVERRSDVSLDAVLDALKTPGAILKQNHKATTRRVGDWVVKESRRTASERLKHALRPARYRCGWNAARALTERGIGVPEPVAYVESRLAGRMIGNAMITEFLSGCVSVEEFAQRLVSVGATHARVTAYLGALAKAVADLNAAGAYHSDLSGKNIFTRTGAEFRFIDLDAIVLDRPIAEAASLLNHVQLYDSFCDLWDDSFLEPFLLPLIPSDRNVEGWMEEVRAGQASRRARVEAVWRRQGRYTA